MTARDVFRALAGFTPFILIFILGAALMVDAGHRLATEDPSDKELKKANAAAKILDVTGAALQGSATAADFQGNMEQLVNGVLRKEVPAALGKLNYWKYPQLGEAQSKLEDAISAGEQRHRVSVPFFSSSFPFVSEFWYLFIPGFHVIPGLNIFSSIARSYMNTGVEFSLGALIILLMYYRYRYKGLSLLLLLRWGILRKEFAGVRAFFAVFEKLISEKDERMNENGVNAQWIKSIPDPARLYDKENKDKLEKWATNLRWLLGHNKKLLDEPLKRVEKHATKQSAQIIDLLRDLEKVKRQFEASKVDVEGAVSAEARGLALPTKRKEIVAPGIGPGVPAQPSMTSDVIARNVERSLIDIDRIVNGLELLREGRIEPEQLGLAGKTITTNVHLKDVYDFLKHFHLVLKAEEVAIKTELEAIEAITKNDEALIRRIGLPGIVKIIVDATEKKLSYWDKQKNYRAYFEDFDKTIYPMLDAWFELEGKKLKDVEFAALALRQAAKRTGIVSYKLRVPPIVVRPMKLEGGVLLETGEEVKIEKLEELWCRIWKIPRPPYKDSLSDGAVWSLLARTHPQTGLNDLALWIRENYRNPDLADEINKLQRPSIGMLVRTIEREGREIRILDMPRRGEQATVEAPDLSPAGVRVLDGVRDRIARLIDDAYSNVLSKRTQIGAWEKG